MADHLFIVGWIKRESYTPPPTMGPKMRIPSRDRFGHGARLKKRFEQAWAAAKTKQQHVAVIAGNPEGFLVQFDSEPNFELDLDKFDLRRDGIELRSVQQAGSVQRATVFVPEGKVEKFIGKFEAYLNEETKTGKPKNQPLVDSISDLRLATIESLWTDSLQFPKTDQKIWWEIWLRSDNGAELDRFAALISRLQLEAGEKYLSFPERTVVLAHATPQELSHSLDLLNDFAELRMAKDTPTFFVRLRQTEQTEWARDLLQRTTPAEQNSPVICILDTGVNRGHLLLQNSLSTQHQFAYLNAWGLNDHHGHGTEMAGLALYGNLTHALLSRTPILLPHRLESAKILPPTGQNPPELYGVITADAAAQAEIANSTNTRVFLLAVSAPDQRDQGIPTSWSAEIDALSAGVDDEDNESKRLFLVAAGNRTAELTTDYFRESLVDSIHDPGQSWNALTIGAHTELLHIDEPTHIGWRPLAKNRQLAPMSTTSTTWEAQWPLKPDLVMEGGNRAISPDDTYIDALDSLSLLTTHHDIQTRLFTTTGDTSAAAAMAARMAASIYARYPKAWPETVRAIMIHSARWSQEMIEQVGGKGKQGLDTLIRCFGYGIPDLEQALESTGNALTLVAQERIYPFEKDKTKEMILHTLPWPKNLLLELGDTDVSLRVTLSYFIEPNPAQRGWKKKHRYASHGLRFDVKTPTESIDQFRSRLNKQAREEEEGVSSSSDSERWHLGPRLRSKGSIHSDVWHGSAAELAERGFIGVYPVIGWWRERHHLNRWQQGARYALLVSIETPATGVDLYIPITTIIEAGIPVEI